MRVRIRDSVGLDLLVEDLRRTGCVPATVDEETVHVIHPNARDAKEAVTELSFFLRAWQARHPEVVLTVS